MVLIVFVIDTSGSMNQRSSTVFVPKVKGAPPETPLQGMSYLDVAKATVENFCKLRVMSRLRRATPQRLERPAYNRTEVLTAVLWSLCSQARDPRNRDKHMLLTYANGPFTISAAPQ